MVSRCGQWGYGHWVVVSGCCHRSGVSGMSAAWSVCSVGWPVGCDQWVWSVEYGQWVRSMGQGHCGDQWGVVSGKWAVGVVHRD